MRDRLTGLLCKPSFVRFIQRSSADWPKMKTCLSSFRESNFVDFSGFRRFGLLSFKH